MIEKWRWWSNDWGDAGVYFSWQSWTFGIETDWWPSQRDVNVHLGPVRILTTWYRRRR